MKSEHVRTARAAKLLLEAVGYLELGMIRQARGCLGDTDGHDALAPAVTMVCEEAARRDGRSSDDAPPVASKPVSEEILLALGHCFWDAGQQEWAAKAFACTQETARPPARSGSRRR
jgi:hypothetical protein